MNPQQSSTPAEAGSEPNSQLPLLNEAAQAEESSEFSTHARPSRHGARTGTPEQYPGGYPPEYFNFPEWMHFQSMPVRRLSEIDDPEAQRRTATATTHTMPTIPSPVPPRTPVRSPNAPQSTGDILARITEVLEILVKKEDSPRCPKGAIPYVYSGRDEEDPHWFVGKLDEFFHVHNIKNDVDRLLYFGAQLQNSAKKWFDTYIDMNVPYSQLRQNFLNHFNSPVELARVRAKLYGAKQAENEPAEKFLMYKKKLFQRLEPQTPENIVVQLLLEQLRPHLRSRLRGARIAEVDEFIKAARDVENDEAEEFRSRTRAVTNPFRQAVAESSNRPPTPCRFCNAWHYHSECQQNPYRQYLNESGTGGNNSRPRAPVQSTTNRQDARNQQTAPSNGRGERKTQPPNPSTSR